MERLVERVKAIIFNPKQTWETIKGEKTTVKDLYTSYGAILAIIPPVASFIGLSLVGLNMPVLGRWRQPIMNGISHAILFYILSLAGTFVTAYVADAIAPSFGSKKNFTGAVKAVVYSYTPTWVIGVFNIIPAFSGIVWIGSLYSLYLLYLGLPAMMETSPEKKSAYVAIVVVSTLLVMFAISLIAGLFLASMQAVRH